MQLVLWNRKGLASETNTRGNYMWQSQVEIKHYSIEYSVAYFDHVTALQVLKCKTSVKGGARMCCVNGVSIHEFTQCI